MKRKIFIFTSILFVLLFLGISVYADANTITSNVSISGDTVHIYGQIPDAVQENMVALIVCEDADNVTEDNIVYIDQTTSSTSGTFEFSFNFPGDSGVTSYEYIIGTNAGTDTYRGIITKEQAEDDEEEEVTPTRTVICTETVEGNSVKISGQISDPDGSNQVGLIVSTDVNNVNENNIVYIDQATSTTSGNFEFTFTLPEDSTITSYGYIIGTDANTATYNGVISIGQSGEEEEVTPTRTVTCTETVEGNNVKISGQISDPDGSNQIGLIVSTDVNNVSENNIVYIDQTASTTSGNFEFTFTLPEDLTRTSYGYIIGTDANTATYTGMIVKEPVVETVQSQFIDADVTVNIKSYVPTIEGTITCMDGYTTTVSIINTTDQTIVANDVLEAGEHTLAYQLPSLVSGKNYDMTVTCTNGTEELSVVSVSIDSSIVLVSISGTVTVADGVTFDVGVQSNNSSLVDKSATISSNKDISVTIPNLISNTSYHLTAKGYATVVEAPPVIPPVVDEPMYEYMISGNAGDVVSVIANAYNVTTFEDKVYELKYDNEQIGVSSLYGTYFEDSIDVGTKGNVEIVSFQPGEIKFKIVNKEIPTGKTWSGILNIFKFKFNQNYSGNSSVKFY